MFQVQECGVVMLLSLEGLQSGFPVVFGSVRGSVADFVVLVRE